MNPNDMRICILRTEGTQCDLETKRAIELAFTKLYSFHPQDYQVQIVRDNRLYRREEKLENFYGLICPGGFSYGDRIRAGAILGKTTIAEIEDDIREFNEERKPILGICNGFQVLVEAGLLPGINGISKTPEIALAVNLPSGYNCEWMRMRNFSGRCIFTKHIDKNRVLRIPVANGEGRLIFPNEKVYENLLENDQIVLRYTKEDGSLANGERPYNYNGTSHDIAAICNREGNVAGMMPHPERASEGWQLPDWTRTGLGEEGDGLEIFKGMLEYIEMKF